jgi:hypothetical protein
VSRQNTDECIAINGSRYETDGVIFNLYCQTNFAGYDLHIGYSDFTSCMDSCAAWNIQNVEKCVGIAWLSTTFGPEGVAGGGECLFKWEMTGDGTPDDTTDCAILQTINVNILNRAM